MVIETNLHMGKGIVRGDQFSIWRDILSIPRGQLVSTAQLTLKSSLSDSDPGVFQKNVTTVSIAGSGQVEDQGSSGVARIRFDIIAGDTLAMTADQDYYFDIQVKLDNSDIKTVESGITSAREQVTVL